MLFTNFTQVIVLILVLIVGLTFGWAMHPGGKKWRVRYDKIVDASNAYRAEIAGHLREAESRAEAAERDNQALRRDLDAARARSGLQAEPVPTGPVPAAEPVKDVEAVETEEVGAERAPVTDRVDTKHAPAATAESEPEATPAEAEAEQPKYWFGWNRNSEAKAAKTTAGDEELSRIRGIDGVLASRLAALDVKHYSDITSLSDQDEMALEQRLNLPAGYITREQWRDQAALLASGQTAEHADRFGIMA